MKIGDAVFPFDEETPLLSKKEVGWTDSPASFAKSLISLRQESDVEEALWRVSLLSSGLLDFDISTTNDAGRSILMIWLDNTLELCSLRGNCFGDYDSKVLAALLESGADPYMEDSSGTNAFGLWKTSGANGAMPRSYIDWRETLPIFSQYVDLCHNHIDGNNGSAVESLVRFAWPQATVLDDLEKIIGREALCQFKSKKGLTLLFLACYELDVSGVEWTMKRLQTDPNVPSIDGLSPFHAITLGLKRFQESDEKNTISLQIAKRIVAMGGDPSKKDTRGKTASEYSTFEPLRVYLESEALKKRSDSGNLGGRRRSSL